MQSTNSEYGSLLGHMSRHFHFHFLTARGFKLKGLQWPETWKRGTANVNLM